MESLGSMQPHPALAEAFDQLSQHHAARLVLRVRSGSHAYGLAHAQSDEDERGVFVIPSAQYGGLKALPSQISDASSDHVYYSLRRTFELLSDSNPGLLEVLFTPDDCVIARDPRLAELFAQRSIFVSQQLVQALLGYASGQIKKARGQNKWINQPQPEIAPGPQQFCYWIPQHTTSVEALPARPKPLSALPVPLSQCHVARVEHGGHLYRIYHIGPEARGVFRGGLPVCESIAPDQELRCFLGLMLFNEQAFQKAKLDHQNYWQWRRERNDSRWLAQEQGMLDFDAKNLMHCMRLLHSACQIAGDAEPMVRVPSTIRAELLAIRAGQLSYQEILVRAQHLMSSCERALLTTSLSQRIDLQKVGALYAQLLGNFEEGG
jgi:hypothetical protein